MGRQQPDIFSDPRAGTPLRTQRSEEDDPRFSDPRAGQPLRVKSRGQQIAGAVAGAAPAIVGGLGGFVGGLPGAAAGGFAGSGISQLVEHGAEIPGALADVARNLIREPSATVRGFHEGVAEGGTEAAKAAGLQGAAEFTGGKVAQAGGALAKWLMNRATTRVTERLMREFPDLQDTLIDKALTVSKGGYEKAKRLLSEAKGKTAAALKMADEGGQTVPVQLTEDIAESFKTALLEDAIKARGIPVSEGAVMTARNRLPEHLRGLFQQIDRAAASGTPMELKPSMADVLKRRLQKESKNTYANRNAPLGPRAMSAGAEELTEFAARVNDAIDAIAPGYRASNTEAQPLIGAVRGIKQAIRPTGNLYQAMVRPGIGAAAGALSGGELGLPAWAGAIGGAALMSPAGMSREAIILRDPRVQQLLKQLPRASALALTELLGELTRGQTPAPATPAGSPQ